MHKDEMRQMVEAGLIPVPTRPRRGNDDDKSWARSPLWCEPWEETDRERLKRLEFVQEGGLATWLDGWLVVDVDGDEGDAWVQCRLRNGMLPPAPVLMRGDRYSLWYQAPNVERRRKRVNASLELLATGLKQVEGHWAGLEDYSWATRPPWRFAVEAPQWLQNRLRAPQAGVVALTPGKTPLWARMAAYLARCEPAVEGKGGWQRTQTTTFCFVQKFGGEVTRDGLIHALSTWNARCDPPWSDRAMEMFVDSALEARHEK